MTQFIIGLVIGGILGVIVGGTAMYADGLKKRIEEKEGEGK